MPWARLEDNYFRHRKVVDLSKDAKLLDLAAIAFSARELRDGELSRGDVRVIAAEVDVDNSFAVADQLVAAGRWMRNGEMYVIHDYLTYNPSREKVLKERESGLKRLQEWRAKHPKPTRKRANSRNGVTNAVCSPDPDPEPGPGNETPVPVPVPNSEPGDARATREGSEFKTGESKRRKRPSDEAPTGANSLGGANRATSVVLLPPDANGAVHFERVEFNRDLAVRIKAIGEDLEDDNVAASITRAQRCQAAAHLDDGTMASAIKDARRRVQRRLDDFNRGPPNSPMAYFLGILEQTTRERATT